MTKYFTKDTPLASLERMMMSVPRFAPRHSGIVILRRFQYGAQDVACKFCPQFQRRKCAADNCPWLRERMEAGTVTYGELMAACFRELDHQPLKRRIAAVTHGVARLNYTSQEHRQRMSGWQRDNGSYRPEDIKPRRLAALFLLTSSGNLWARTQPAVTWNGVDFSKITLRDTDLQDYAIYQAAKSLYTGKLKITAGELADRELVSDATLRLIIDAVLIARYGGAALGTGSEPWLS